MLSQRTRYTIRALLHLADRYGEGPVQLGEIAQAQNLPPKFLTVILSQMRRAGLVETMRGREGGYWLARPPAEVTYGEIVRLTRGSLGLLPCASRYAHQPCKNCITQEKCRLHRAMLLVRDETARILDGLSLADPVQMEELRTDRDVAGVNHVAVVGAGASGTLQALHLVRAGTDRVTLIERERIPGRGTAYGTRRPEHLLNVTASRMIVYPDDPGHFARWFGERGGEADDYAQRRLFGDYVCELMAEAGDRIRIVPGEAVNIVAGHGGEEVRLRDGTVVAADAVVLALGNLRPATPPGIRPERLGGIYVDDPWFGRLTEDLPADGTVLLIGTGLTAIDAALTLDAEGFGGRIVGISRRGLAPRPHLRHDISGGAKPELPRGCVNLLRAVRRRGDAIGWREAVQEMRPVTQQIWAEASLDERRRFVRHLRPWWDVHRHRIAPAVADRIEAMQRGARLRFAAGRIVGAEPDGDAAEVTWRPRGRDEARRFRAHRIVNCTGPDVDIARTGDALLDGLLAAGRIRPDALRLGIDVDPDSRIIDGDGRASQSLTAIGPITRGAFWENVAVPDIAVQAQAVARRLAA